MIAAALRAGRRGDAAARSRIRRGSATAATLRQVRCKAHRRVGRSGCWREAFSGEQREAFEAVAARFGLRLEKKGWGFVEEDS